MKREDLFKVLSGVNDAWSMAYDLRKAGVSKVEYVYKGSLYVIDTHEVLRALNTASIYFHELYNVFSVKSDSVCL